MWKFGEFDVLNTNKPNFLISREHCQALLLLVHVRILIQFYFIIWPSLIPAGEQKLNYITISTKIAYFIYSI